MPAANAAAAPPLDPPGVIALFQGFKVAPCRSLSVNQRQEKAGVLVRPMMIAPAFFRLAATGASSGAITSRNATMPFVVGVAALVGIDLERHGDAVQRAERLAAAHLLVGFAGGNERLVLECLDDGVDARVDGGERSSAAETASRAEIARVRIACARSAASHCQSCPCIDPSFRTVRL